MSRHPTGNKEEDAKLMTAGISILGRFSPRIVEEALTTKTFAMPGSSQIITASVYYTDEMMFSGKSKTPNSMLVGIAVSRKAQEAAFSVPNSAAAEITYTDNADTVRVKTNVRVSGRQYLVGLECRIQREFDETDPKKQKN